MLQNFLSKVINFHIDQYNQEKKGKIEYNYLFLSKSVIIFEGKEENSLREIFIINRWYQTFFYLFKTIIIKLQNNKKLTSIIKKIELRNFF